MRCSWPCSDMKDLWKTLLEPNWIIEKELLRPPLVYWFRNRYARLSCKRSAVEDPHPDSSLSSNTVGSILQRLSRIYWTADDACNERLSGVPSGQVRAWSMSSLPSCKLATEGNVIMDACNDFIIVSAWKFKHSVALCRPATGFHASPTAQAFQLQ
jgi:hypothetical protein